MERASDSDDDRPVGELTESDVEMMRRIFPDRCDPRVHEFSDLADMGVPLGPGQGFAHEDRPGVHSVHERARFADDV